MMTEMAVFLINRQGVLIDTPHVCGVTRVYCLVSFGTCRYVAVMPHAQVSKYSCFLLEILVMTTSL